MNERLESLVFMAALIAACFAYGVATYSNFAVSDDPREMAVQE